MNSPAEASVAPAAGWQPLTFGGVAAFAGARFVRLLVIEVAAAIFLSACVVWFLHRNYSPIIQQAIDTMPETARIARGRLQGVPRPLISESKFLAIAISAEADKEIGQGADLQIELRQTDFCANSVFRPDWGLEFEYGARTSLDLSRSQLEPRWGAWQPVVLTGAGIALVPILLLTWWLLAAFYVAPALLVAWYADRRMSWKGAWRVSAAALVPGSLLLGAAILSYALRAIDLLGLAFFYLAHLVMGWVYVVGGVCAAPQVGEETAKRNPFSA